MSFSARLDEIAREKGVAPAAIEVWFADEACVGQNACQSRRRFLAMLPHLVLLLDGRHDHLDALVDEAVESVQSLSE